MEFLSILAISCIGSTEEKFTCLFQLYNIQGGVANKETLTQEEFFVAIDKTLKSLANFGEI